MKKLLFVVVYIIVIQVVYAQQTDKSFIFGGEVNFLLQENPSNTSEIIPSSFGLTSISHDSLDSKYSTFTIKPYLGLELNQKFLVGLQLDYGIEKYTERITQYLITGVIFSPTDPTVETEIKANSTRIGVGGFSRYTLNPQNMFRLFMQPYLKYVNINTKASDFINNANLTYAGPESISEIKWNSFEVGVGLGAMYCFNDRIRATFTIGGIRYERGTVKRSSSSLSSSSGFEEEETFSAFGSNINTSSVFFGIEFRL